MTSPKPGDLIRAFADVVDQLSTGKEGPVTALTFFDTALNHMTPSDIMILVGKIIEKVDEQSLRLINAMSWNEGKKRGLIK